MSANGCVAFGRLVAGDGARRATGAGAVADLEDVVVKVVRPGSDEGLAWGALRHFGGRGCVRLLGRSDDAVLMERASPGRPLVDLARAGRDDEATAVLCDVAAALHDQDALVGAPAFPSVAEWGRGFERYRRSGDAAIPAPLLDRAEGVFRELIASQAAPRLLHGDLHHENVLLDARRGWLAIDPKGVMGERAYEVGAVLRNPWGDGFDRAVCVSPAVVDRRSRIITERLGLDRRRVLEWGFAQAVLSAVWSREDGEAPDHALAVADAISRTPPT